MSEPRDDLDSWLDEPVRPMLPRPGAFERIRRHARRRKMLRAAASAAAVAVVLVSAAVVPRLVIHQFSPDTRLASGLPSEGSSPRFSRHPAGRQPTPLQTAGPSPATVPGLSRPRADFQVSSVTFVGSGTGWVIGQAGKPGSCPSPSPGRCTSIARTDDTGQTWYTVNAPPAGTPDGSRGVSQIRFLNTDGWAFGPELWATHDAGKSWARIPTHGMRVIALETRGSRAFAVWARCGGTGPAFATGCTSFSLYSAAAGSDRWAPVAGAAGLNARGGSGSAALVLTGGQVYLLAPGGKLLSGPVTSIAGPTVATAGGLAAAVPCAPGPPAADGQPSRALFASTGRGPDPELILLCLGQPAGNAQAKTLYYSTDNGTSWHPKEAAPQAGIAESLSGTPSGCVVLATNQGIEVSSSAGGPWRTARGYMPPGGFTYVGMTTSRQGVALPADRNARAVWITRDFATTWAPATVTSPRS